MRLQAQLAAALCTLHLGVRVPNGHACTTLAPDSSPPAASQTAVAAAIKIFGDSFSECS